MLNLNRVFGAAALAIIMMAALPALSATVNKVIIDVPKMLKVASIPNLVPVTIAPVVNLRGVISELTKFHAIFSATKPKILAHEEAGYISVIDNPKDSVADAKAVQQRIATTRKTIIAMDNKIRGRISQLDRLVLKADNYCGSQLDAKTEALCVTTHDHIGQYEGEVSVITAMFEVMEKRYLEAKMVLQS